MIQQVFRLYLVLLLTAISLSNVHATENPLKANERGGGNKAKASKTTNLKKVSFQNDDKRHLDQEIDFLQPLKTRLLDVAISPIEAEKFFTLSKPGAEPIIFKINASKDSVGLNEEFTLTISAELLPYTGMFFLPEWYGYSLKMVLPEGFEQTGGDYYDNVNARFTRGGLEQMIYTLKGKFTHQQKSTNIFKLLRGFQDIANSRYFLETEKKIVLKNKIFELNKKISSSRIAQTLGKPTISVTNVNVNGVNYTPPTDNTVQNVTICSGGKIEITYNITNTNGAKYEVYPYIHTQEFLNNQLERDFGCFNKYLGIDGQKLASQFVDYIKNIIPRDYISSIPSNGTITSRKFEFNVLKFANDNGFKSVNLNHFDVALKLESGGIDFYEYCNIGGNLPNITINQVVAAPTNLNSVITNSGVSLSGNCTAPALIEWFKDANATVPTTSPVNLTEPITLYARCKKDNCSSNLVPFFVCTTMTPPSIVGSNSYYSGDSPVTLTASGCPANTVTLWENGSTGNTISVSPTQTTQYRAKCLIGESSCSSGWSNTHTLTYYERRPVTVSTTQVPPRCYFNFSSISATVSVLGNYNIRLYNANTYSTATPNNYISQISTNAVTATYSFPPQPPGAYKVVLFDKVTGVLLYEDPNNIVSRSYPSPQANISVNTPCEGETLTFSISNENNVNQYAWYKENNETGEAELLSSDASFSIPNASAIHAGSYYLELSSEQGCGDNMYFAVRVKPKPSAPTTNSIYDLCENKNFNIASSKSTRSKLIWYRNNEYLFEGDNYALSPVQSTYAGEYSVVSELDGCRSATKNFTITTKSNPVLDITGRSAYCFGENIELNATGADNYKWYFEGKEDFLDTGDKIIISNSSISGSLDKPITVILEGEKNGCSSLKAFSFTAHSIPSINVLTNNTVCENTDLQFHIVDTQQNTTFDWFQTDDNPANKFPNKTIRNIALSSAGRYLAHAVNNITGCQNFHEFNLVVHPAPVVSITTNRNTICRGEEVIANVVDNTPHSNNRYSWSTSYLTTLVWGEYIEFYSQSSEFKHQVPIDVFMNESQKLKLWTTAPNSCVTYSEYIIKTKEKPDFMLYNNANLISTGDDLFVRTDSDFATYAWSKPNSASVDGTNKELIITNASVANSGTYTLSVVDQDQCTNQKNILVTVPPYRCQIEVNPDYKCYIEKNKRYLKLEPKIVNRTKHWTGNLKIERITDQDGKTIPDSTILDYNWTNAESREYNAPLLDKLPYGEYRFNISENISADNTDPANMCRRAVEVFKFDCRRSCNTRPLSEECGMPATIDINDEIKLESIKVNDELIINDFGIKVTKVTPVSAEDFSWNIEATTTFNILKFVKFKIKSKDEPVVFNECKRLVAGKFETEYDPKGWEAPLDVFGAAKTVFESAKKVLGFLSDKNKVNSDISKEDLEAISKQAREDAAKNLPKAYSQEQNILLVKLEEARKKFEIAKKSGNETEREAADKEFKEIQTQLDNLQKVLNKYLETYQDILLKTLVKMWEEYKDVPETVETETSNDETEKPNMSFNQAPINLIDSEILTEAEKTSIQNTLKEEVALNLKKLFKSFVKINKENEVDRDGLHAIIKIVEKATAPKEFIIIPAQKLSDYLYESFCKTCPSKTSDPNEALMIATIERAIITKIKKLFLERLYK